MDPQRVNAVTGEQRVWVFGYGSLIWDGWEVELGCLAREVATLTGYRRSFNKLSQRNWGTKQAPCPTLNLQVDTSASCQGVAFAFPEARRSDVLGYLGEREGRNFELRALSIRLLSGVDAEALVPLYIGQNLCGDIDFDERLNMIRTARGTDGSGTDYVLGLAKKLEELGIVDPAVRKLQTALAQ